jgi:hypothetical protein
MGYAGPPIALIDTALRMPDNHANQHPLALRNVFANMGIDPADPNPRRHDA